MAKIIMFVHTEKVPVRSQKYPHLNLSRSTTVFPASASEYLSRLGKGKSVKAEIEAGELEQANQKWLLNRIAYVPIRGELYRGKFLDEIAVLREWAELGVSEKEFGEYSRRLNLLRKEADLLKARLFETGSAAKIISEISRLSEPKHSEKGKFDPRSKLKRITSPEQELFKSKVEEALIRPMDIEELSRELRMTASNMRKRLAILSRSGLVKSTTQRLPLGRPKVVYFLAQDI